MTVRAITYRASLSSQQQFGSDLTFGDQRFAGSMINGGLGVHGLPLISLPVTVAVTYPVRVLVHAFSSDDDARDTG